MNASVFFVLGDRYTFPIRTCLPDDLHCLIRTNKNSPVTVQESSSLQTTSIQSISHTLSFTYTANPPPSPLERAPSWIIGGWKPSISKSSEPFARLSSLQDVSLKQMTSNFWYSQILSIIVSTCLVSDRIFKNNTFNSLEVEG